MSHKALIDDPEWVLARYFEAKELIDEMWCDPSVPTGFRMSAAEFHATTAMDTCTTLGPDCACNGKRDS